MSERLVKRGLNRLCHAPPRRRKRPLNRFKAKPLIVERDIGRGSLVNLWVITELTEAAITSAMNDAADTPAATANSLTRTATVIVVDLRALPLRHVLAELEHLAADRAQSALLGDQALNIGG
jgi:hypothetical protein